jgi:hypothetical protein
LRLETASEIDKEKSEFYFRRRIKKFLTKNRVRIVESHSRGNPNGEVDPINWDAQRCHGFSLRWLRAMTKGRPQGTAVYKPSTQKRSGNRGINRRSVSCCIALVLSFAFSFSAPAAEDIPPPFGFKWNDSMTKLETTLTGAKAKIVSREKKEKRDVWTVEGLVQPGLRRTLFMFRDGFLVEVELQYEYPDWTIERFNERMGEIRRYFDAKFGTGKLVSRSRDTDSDVIQTLVGYQWIVGGTMLELFYFSAQRDKDVFRSISVTYKAI